MTHPDRLIPVDDTDFLRVQRFLHDEAAILDAHDYAAWWALLTDDFVYRVWTQVVRPGDGQNQRLTIVDEAAGRLKLRVDQLADPKLTHAENPRSLTRRFLSNFRVHHGREANSFIARCNLLVYRNRGAGPAGGFLVGERRDVLRLEGEAFRIAQRDVELDETVLRDSTLSILL